jgi:catecholate siderophore receptor
MVLIAVVAPAHAAGAAPSSDNHDETVVLSPFVVSSETETGYQATSSLAGTRLNTDIKDIGAAVSIYTKDFMQDIGATSARDLLVYATGVEVGGVNGNYFGNSPGATTATSESGRSNPQGATRIRGLASADLARGYFNTDIAFDDYNTSEITVSRGPNAILFGLGSPAGIINQGLIRADYRNRGSVTYRIGSNTTDNFSNRVALDINHSLSPNKLALRVAALHDDEKFKQKPAFEDDHRIFLSALYEPFKATALRVSYERGKIRANRPTPVMPLDNITPWFESGKYLYDFARFDRNPALNAGVAPQIPTASQGRNTMAVNTMAVFYDNSQVDTVSRALRTQILANEQTGPHAAINVDGQPEAYNFYGSANLSNIRAGYRDQGLSPSTRVFDWNNRMFEGSTAFQNEDFSALNVALERRAWEDRIGIELALDRQDFDRETYMPFGNRAGSYVFVDINTTLSSGQPNPNVGRPFVVTGAVNRNTMIRDRETRQATGFLRYDFKDTGPSWGAWLGRHTLTGLAQKQKINEINYIQKLVMDSQSGLLEQVLGAPERPQNRQLNRVVYVGPSLLSATSVDDLRLQPIDIPIFTPGLPVQGSLWNPVTQSFETVNATSRLNLNGGTLSETEIESYAAVFESHWLKDNLVTLIGWRHDETSLDASSPPAVPASVDANNPFTFDGWTLPGTPTIIKQDGWSYSAVLRLPATLSRRIPGLSEFSLFFNKSQNFSAAANRIDYLARSLPNPEGETKEIGLNLSLLAGRLNIRVNRFETVSSNTTGTNIVNENMNQFFSMLGGWETSMINNPASVVTASDLARLSQGVEDTLAQMRRAFNYSVVTNSVGVASYSFRNPEGLADTIDFEAKGYEMDIVYNPTPNWRMLLNVAKQDTVQSNVAPVATEWLALMRSNYDAVAHLPYNGVSGETVGARFDSRLYTPHAQLKAQTGTQAYDQRRWRINYVNSYTFAGDTALKGLSLGAGVRWQDEAIVGYPFVTLEGISQPDLSRPTISPAQLNVDTWIGYSRPRVWRNVGWKIQLNVHNLVADDDFIPIGVQPDGSVSQYRIPAYRTWTITNTFSF